MVRFVTLAISGFLAACASSGDGSSSGAGAQRISTGMQRLGASETRSACYGQRLADSLDSNAENEAVQLVEKASNKAEMRSGVLNASGDVRRAFIGASMRCGT